MTNNAKKNLTFYKKSDLPWRLWSKLLQIDDFKSFYDNLQWASKTIWVYELTDPKKILYNIDNYYVIVETTYMNPSPAWLQQSIILSEILKNPISNDLFYLANLSWIEFIIRPLIFEKSYSEYIKEIAEDIEFQLISHPSKTVMNYINAIESATSAITYHKWMARLLRCYFTRMLVLSRDNMAHFDQIFNESTDYLLSHGADYATDARLFFDTRFSLKDDHYYFKFKKGPKINYYIYKKR